ncbi:MAG: hypothetical protein ISS00_04125 [Candidatus Marinimicrobia bacterium]|nr:hypothetical protein [Candidatus Neomarinimicrobiota bacterium]
MKKITVSFLILFTVFAYSYIPIDAYEIGQLREILEEASRTSQKVFVEEFTGIS